MSNLPDKYVLHLHAHGRDWYLKDMSRKGAKFVSRQSHATQYNTPGEAIDVWDMIKAEKNIRGWNVAPRRVTGRRGPKLRVVKNPHKIGAAGLPYKMVPANKLKVGDEVHQHGARFKVKKIIVSQSHTEENGKVHANLCEYLGPVRPGHEPSIPAHWRDNWNIQGNSLHMVAKIIKKRGSKKVLKNPHKAGSADKAAAKELLLFIENDGDLYRQQTSAIQKNLSKKFKAGKYSSTKAAKLWTYLADNGAKKYTWEYGDRRGSWHSTKGYGFFSAATRRLVGRLLEKSWHAEMKAGNFHA